MSGITPLEPDCWVGKVADLLSHSRDAQVALVGEEAQHLLDKEMMGPDEMAHRMTRIQKAAQAVIDACAWEKEDLAEAAGVKDYSKWSAPLAQAASEKYDADKKATESAPAASSQAVAAGEEDEDGEEDGE